MVIIATVMITQVTSNVLVMITYVMFNVLVMITYVMYDVRVYSTSSHHRCITGRKIIIVILMYDQIK